MKSRHSFFVVEKKGEYYDTQDEIAKALHIDRKTVQRRVKILMDNGIVVGKKVKSRNYLNWQYRQVKNLKLWILDEKGGPEVIVQEQVSRKSKVQPAKPKLAPVYEDDSDLPF